MTQDQMHEMFKAFGGVTLKNALLISIVKYLQLSDHWRCDNAEQFKGLPLAHAPESENCALCHYIDSRNLTCEDCILDACWNPGTLYQKLYDANCKRDFDAFNKARRRLLSKFTTAYANLEKGKNESKRTVRSGKGR